MRCQFHARLYFCDAFADPFRIHFVHIDADTGSFEQQNRQSSAEVLTEFFQASKHCVTTMRIDLQQMVVESWHRHGFEHRFDALSIGLTQQTCFHRVTDIEPQADRYGGGVAEGEAAELFEFVCRPVTEVQWSAATHFKRIAAHADVSCVPESGAFDALFERTFLQ